MCSIRHTVPAPVVAHRKDLEGLPPQGIERVRDGKTCKPLSPRSAVHAFRQGNVEELVGYARRNFMMPAPRVASWEEFRGILVNREVEIRRPHPRWKKAATLPASRGLPPRYSTWLRNSSPN